MSLVQQIRDALRDSEGMNAAQLADALGEDAAAIRKACSQGAWSGEFVSRREDGGIVYAINPDGSAKRKISATAPVPPPGAKAKKPKLTGSTQNAEGKPKAKPSRKRDFLAACDTADKTLKALKFSADTSADALQVYLHSVADPAIFAPLKTAADQARTALDAFVAQGR